MSHRLLHSLVFSSIVVLEGAGCTESHAPPTAASDASAEPADASVLSPDAWMPDVRLCEAGWPTTKAMTCVEVEAMDLFRCCPTGHDPETDPDACCYADPMLSEETP